MTGRRVPSRLRVRSSWKTWPTPGWRPLGLWGLWLVLSTAAHAHTVSDEVALGSTQHTEQNPRSGSLSNTFSGMFEASDALSLSVDLGLTHDNGTASVASARAGASSGGNILLGTLTVDALLWEKWLLAAGVNVSPRSVTTSRVPVPLVDTLGRETEADAELRTASNVLGFMISGGYATAGLSDFEASADASLGLTRFSVQQSITEIQTALGPLSAEQVRTFCMRPALSRQRRSLCKTVLSVLKNQPSTLNQLRLSVSFTGTIFQDTDIGILASLYGYDGDPTEVGYFSVLAVGRSVSLGNGIPLAPLQFSLRPSVTHRFGRLSLDGSYQFGRYVDDEGAFHALSLRAQYRFNKTWRAWLRFSGQVDLDADGKPLRSSAVSVGVRCAF